METSIGLKNLLMFIVPYRKMPEEDEFGNEVVGYGHILRQHERGRLIDVNLELAELLLDEDLDYFSSKLEKLVKVPLAQGQFDALVSFCMHIGLRRFKRSCVLRTVNFLDLEDVPRQLLRWIYSADENGRFVENDALIYRRRQEAFMFKGGDK